MGRILERLGELLGRPPATTEPQRVALVIIDISGYTGYLRFHKTALVHAHEAISQLLESVIDRASHPLTLNKLQGDAALLYARLGSDEASAARDIAWQVGAFFEAFHARAKSLAASRKHCPCEACQGILDLRLKAFLHAGVAAFRRIRQFEELGGEDLIVVHRLLKNSIPEREYVFLTEAYGALHDGLPGRNGRPHEEPYEDIGTVRGTLFPLNPS